MERSEYRAFLHSGAMLAEATGVECVKEKRRRRKDLTSLETNVFITLYMLPFIPLHFLCTHFRELVHVLNYYQCLYNTRTT